MFYKQGDEERGHALKFVKYLVETGGALRVPAVKEPKAEFKSVEEAVKVSLDWEIEGIVGRGVEVKTGVRWGRISPWNP
jgi:ferritin